MRRRRLLDLFCGAGGCAVGYSRAGFDQIVGVDKRPMPRYPFTFVLEDALEYVVSHGHEFDVIHASPPCQSYSSAVRHLSRQYPLLIDVTRELIKNRPYIIENVLGSPLPGESTLFGVHGIELCGTMFGLRVWRHRRFESNVMLAAPKRGCNHRQPPLNPYRTQSRRRDGIERNSMLHYAIAMGTGWMKTSDEIGESIPPVYTEFIGKQLIESV